MESASSRDSNRHSKGASLDTLLGDCISREEKNNKIFIKPFIIHLQSFGITCDHIKPFCNLIISFSKRGSESNFLPDNEKVKKKDILDLLECLFNTIDQKDSIKKRSFKRISYKFGDILFTYIASVRPEVMHQIANNYFIDFTFHLKVNNIVDLSAQWNKYVDDIQNFIKSATIKSTIPDINSFVNTHPK